MSIAVVQTVAITKKKHRKLERSIMAVQTTTITKKKHCKKVFIVAVIQPAAISNKNATKTYMLRRFYILLLQYATKGYIYCGGFMERHYN